MTSYFLDTSAVLKRYVSEIGTVWIRSLCLGSAGHRLIIGQTTRVELMSGVARRVREGVIVPRTAQSIRLFLTRHLKRQYVVITLTDDILRLAEEIVERHPLRAADAMQLATALYIQQRLTSAKLPPLVFISADTRLLTAAVGEGLAIDDPNQHP